MILFSCALRLRGEKNSLHDDFKLLYSNEVNLLSGGF